MRKVGFAAALASAAAGCATGQADPPLARRGLVEVPTAVAGVLRSDGYCYWLENGGSRKTILWVEGTSFGKDAGSRFVVDIAGTKKRVGETVGLSGGPASAEILSRRPRFAPYVRRCGSDLINGLRFVE